MILYVSKSCVVNGEMLKVLEGFHHRAVRQITGMTEKSGTGEEWEYPLVLKAMENTGLQPIRLYIKMRQAAIEERVACRPRL